MPDKISDVVPQVLEVELESGRRIRFHEPSLLDLADVEEAAGKPLARLFEGFADPRDVPLRTLGLLMWVSCRKDGASREDQLARRWPLSLDELMAELSPRDLRRHAEAFFDFFGRWTRDGAASSPSPP